MKTIVPNYYKNFKCIADQCRHNCCIGWEIDIDEDTYRRYCAISGPFGERLQNSICHEDPPYFILGKEERCPFLNQRNLCDIITELGEEHLCQICNDHPRFRNEFTSHTEMGLGLCCEAAGRIILTQKEPFSLNATPKSPCREENDFFAFRELLFSILQDRSRSLLDRINDVLQRMNCRIPSLNWTEVFRKLERLDPTWDKYIENVSLPTKIPTEWGLPLEQLIIYFLYRHLPDGLEDGRLRERTTFCILSTLVIAGLFLKEQHPTIDGFIEIARLYSAEIEYSDENIEILLHILQE